jgi:hypothetical protein
LSQHLTVAKASDLDNLFAEGCVHLVELPAPDEDLQRLRAAVFATAAPGDPLLITSTKRNDFSWELINRLIINEPGLGSASDLVEIDEEGGNLGNDCTVLLLPSVLADTDRLTDARPYTENAVILTRRNVSLTDDVAALSQLLRRHGLTIRGVVVVDSKPSRWRKWRRFARGYGFGSDPEHPWPAIDVLDEENARTRRTRKRKHDR